MITDSTVTAQSGAVDMTASSYIIGNIISAATNADLVGVGQIGNNTIAAGETVTLAGKGPAADGIVDLTNNTVLAKNIVAIDNIQNIIGGVYTSAETTTMTAGIEIGGVTVQATKDATLTTVDGDIVNSTIEGTPVALHAGRHITNVSVDSEAEATLIAKQDISGTDVKARQDIVITATDGTIQGVTAMGEAAIKLTAKEEIDGSAFTATGDLTVQATDLVESSFISETGAITVGAVANIIDSAIWAKVGAVDIGGDTGVSDEIDGSTISAADGLTLKGNWIVGSSLIAEGGLLDVTATTIDASELLSKQDSIDLDVSRLNASSLAAAVGIDVDGVDKDFNGDDILPTITAARCRRRPAM